MLFFLIHVRTQCHHGLLNVLFRHTIENAMLKKRWTNVYLVYIEKHLRCLQAEILLQVNDCSFGPSSSRSADVDP